MKRQKKERGDRRGRAKKEKVKQSRQKRKRKWRSEWEEIQSRIRKNKTQMGEERKQRVNKGHAEAKEGKEKHFSLSYNTLQTVTYGLNINTKPTML